MSHDPTGNAAVSSGVAPLGRLLIVVSEDWNAAEREIVDAMSAQGGFGVTVATTPNPSRLRRLPMGERVYQALDRLLFARRDSGRPHTKWLPEGDDLDAIARRVGPVAVLDLTGTLTEIAQCADIPIIRLQFEGEPAKDVARAVRGRLGIQDGTVLARATLQNSIAPIELFSGACFIDHRSLARSVDLLVQKVPMLVQAGVCRLDRRNDPQQTTASSEPRAARLRSSTLVGRLIAAIGRRLFWRVQWKMVLFRDQRKESLRKPWATLSPNAQALWADPFVAPHDGGAAVFFEELPYSTGKGRISLIIVDDEGHVGAPTVVLDQPWHLSYPFLFTWNGKHYMLPESSANETLDLYECTAFPRHWRHVQTLVSGRRLADASIVFWGDRLWLFAAHGQRGASNYDELHVYWATDVVGPWHAHSLNPVKINAGSARPAGAMFVAEGRLIRPTQDCRNHYGNGVSFQEVTVLDESRFEERFLYRLAPSGVAPGEYCHTYNEAGRFIVVDTAVSVWRWWAALRLTGNRRIRDKSHV